MRPRSRLGTQGQTQVIDRLSKRLGRYALVVGVARRAHELKDRVDTGLEPSGGGLINRAIEEIARGDVRILRQRSEEEED
jgi:DNA-directed RNA polymerase subunit K/omega